MVTRVDKFLGGLGIDATDKFEVSSNATVTVGNGTSTGNVHVGGRVAIGNSPAEADLYVRGDSVGTSAGDQSLVGVFRADASNQNRIEISATREDAGSTWNDAGMRIQQKVDTTYQSYIQFNGSNNDHGISFGTGSSATATGVAERMRIVTGTGNVGIGTTTPSERLEVNGTVKATSFIGGVFGDSEASATNEVAFRASITPVSSQFYSGTYVWGFPFSIDKRITTAINYADLVVGAHAGVPSGWLAIYERTNRTQFGNRIMANTVSAFSSASGNQRRLFDSTPSTLDSGDYWFAFSISGNPNFDYFSSSLKLQELSATPGSFTTYYCVRSDSTFSAGTTWAYDNGVPPLDGSGLALSLNTTNPAYFALII